MLRISIVTPSYNQARYIQRTIESIVTQTGAFELDYRVVDGASTDGTREILERYEGRLVFTSEKDSGQVDAINKGLHAAQGDVVGWVNSDDLLLPGALARVADAFASHPEAEWVHGRCEIIDEDDRPIRRWISLYKHVRAKRHTLGRLLLDNYICQMSTFWRRSVHDEIGYLDPSFRLAFDYDFWLRLAARGDPVYVPDRLACFRWYDTSKSGSGFDAQFRENMAIAVRHARGDSRLFLLRKRARNAVYAAIYRAMARGR